MRLRAKEAGTNVFNFGSELRKGAIARVDIVGPQLALGRGTLRFLVPPELLPGAD